MPERSRLPWRWSVRARILTTMLLVTAGAMLAAGATTFLVQRAAVLERIDVRLTAHVGDARLIALGAGEGEAFDSTGDALEAVISRVAPGPNESSIGILGGQPAYVPGVTVPFRLDDDLDLVSRMVDEVADGTVRLGTATSYLGNLRYVVVPVTVGDGEAGVYIAAIDIDAELGDLTSSIQLYAWVSLGALLIIGLVGWLVAGRLLAPIRQLRAAAERITGSDRSERIPVTGRDDVSDLTRTVNDMLDRLDAALTGQQHLLDDVRHELKTPITVVRGHLELLDPADPREVNATRDLAIDELDRMTGLIDGIATLAESRSAELTLVDVRADALTAEVFAKARVIRRHEWVLGETSPARVSLDVAKITQAWLQLVDNAAKYAPAGTPVTIGSDDTTDSVELWVQDAGPGIPPEARERIFERFGRAETGRGISGSGLGLTIVRAIMTAHHGRVIVRSGTAGTRIGLELPRSTGNRRR
jgi:signal transduction histidine kinase